MKTILFTTALFLFSATNTSVYICVSKSSEVFHYKKECQGIKRCSHEVKVVSLETAISMGRRECGYEK